MTHTVLVLQTSPFFNEMTTKITKYGRISTSIFENLIIILFTPTTNNPYYNPTRTTTLSSYLGAWPGLRTESSDAHRNCG